MAIKRILDIVDDQNDFMLQDGNLPVPGAEKIIQTTNKFFERLQKDYFDMALFKQDTHFADEYPNSPEAQSFPNIHCEYNSKGWDLAINPNLLKDKTRIFYMIKNTFNMWAENPVKEDITFQNKEESKAYKNLYKITHDPKYLTSGVPRDNFFGSLKDAEVVIIGVASDYCVHDAILGYLERGAKVTVLEDLTKGIGTPVEGRAPSGNICDVVQLDCFKPYIDNKQLSLTNSDEFLEDIKPQPPKNNIGGLNI